MSSMQDYLVETIGYRGFKIKIYQDDMQNESPDDWGNEDVFLVGYHRDFTVERKNILSKDIAVDTYRVLRNEQEITECDNPERVTELIHDYWIFGLEAYIHSGVRLALSYEGNFCDRRWDVSQLGLVLVRKKECRLSKTAIKRARGLIETWNDYLSGNIYGFQVEDDTEDDIDSCWGFYGDWEKSGILEHAKSAIDYEIKDRLQKRKDQLKAWIRNKVAIEYRTPFNLTGDAK